MSITCRFTIGQRLDRTFQLGLSRVTNDRRALPEPSCYPLDLAGADEPHEVLLDAWFGGSRPVNRLGQLQGRTARLVLDEIEQNLDLGQFGARFGLPLRASIP
jgi:hypothetical protein